jgi:hypothetical protein
MARTPNKSWVQILRSIHTPLGVFVLALLIIEATLTIVLTCAGFNEDHKWHGFLWMVGAFAAVVLIVTAFTIWNPKNLLYGKEEHLAPQVDPSALKDQIEDLIVANVKTESLKKNQNGLG